MIRPDTASRSWMVIALVVVAAFLVMPTGAQASGDVLSSPGWEWFKSLTWPAAVAVVFYSPPARALASWLTGLATGKTGGGSPLPSGPIKLDSDTMRILEEMVRTLQRTAELQSEHGKLLQELSRGMTILLDRIQR